MQEKMKISKSFLYECIHYFVIEKKEQMWPGCGFDFYSREHKHNTFTATRDILKKALNFAKAITLTWSYFALKSSLCLLR